jgi:hypothetical protein
VEPYVLQAVPSRVECFIDGCSFGQFEVPQPINQPLAAVLAVGNHQFDIQQASGAFFFQSVKVWLTPKHVPVIPFEI